MKPNYLSFIIIFLICLPILSFSQVDLVKTNGNYCEGSTATFELSGGDCFVNKWNVEGAERLNSDGISINVRWTGSSARISADYICVVSGGTATTGWQTISSAVTPSVSISANKNNVCEGTSITFTASPGNGGSSPYYSWRKNGSTISGSPNNKTFTTSNFNDGDVITCVMSTSVACYSGYSATSNGITVNLTSPNVMTAEISGDENVCSGTPVSYSVNVTNGVGNLSYDWKRNGSYLTQTELDYIQSIGVPDYVCVLQNINNGDNISCEVSSDNSCTPSVTSDALQVTVSGKQTFTVSISPNDISFCDNENVQLTANTSHPATSYQWRYNGSNINGANGSTYSTGASTEADLQKYSVVATTGSGCLNNTTANASTSSIPFELNPLPTATINVGGGSTTACGSLTLNSAATGTGYTYSWKNSSNTEVSTSSSYTATASGTYTLTTRLNGCNNTSAGTAITINPTPSAPGVSAASGITFNSFTANWSSVSGISQYLLYVSTTSNFSSYVSGYNGLQVNGTSKSLTGLQSNTTYYYRVRAKGSCTSGYSASRSVLTKLAIPEVNSSNITNSSFTVSWGAVSGASEYRLDVSTTSNFSTIISGYGNLQVTGTSRSVTGLQANTTYYVRVRAKSSNNSSVNSSTKNVLTETNAPVASAASSKTANSFTANWAATTGAIDYRLDVSTLSNFSSKLSGYNNLTVTSTSINVTGLNPNTTYYYRIRSRNSAGISGNSNTVTVLTSLSSPNATAADNITTSSFRANWSAVPGATEYRLDVDNNSNFSSMLSGYNNLLVTSTSKTVANLKPNTNYYYRVRAISNSNTYANSNTRTIRTAIAVPDVIANVAMPDQLDASYTASSFHSTGHEAWRARIFKNNGTANWSALTNDQNQYLQMDLGAVKRIEGIVTQGRYNNNQWVKSYTVSYSNDGNSWTDYPGTFTGNNDRHTVVKNTLSSPVSASYIRIKPVTWQGHISMRADVVISSSSSDDVTLLASQPSGANSNRWYAANTGGTPLHTGKSFTTQISSETNFYVSSYNTSNGKESIDRTVVTARLTSSTCDQNLNYVVTNTILEKGIKDVGEVKYLPSNHNSKQTTYFDGLGREMQTVAWQASPGEFDMVTPVQYDAYGRQPFAYLPYVSADNDGCYRPNAINDGLQQNSSGGASKTTTYLSSEQYDFYYPGQTGSVATDPNPYSETIFEPSPLNRVLEQGAPGQTWQPTDANPDNNKTIKYNYRTNGANEVVLWTYDYPDGTPTNVFGTVTHSFYSFENNEGQLFVTETTDEHNNLVIEYKDKQDQVILKKVQARDDVTIDETSHDNFACTYYVYDDFGNLRFVFPPQMVEEIKDGWSVTTNTLNRWAFQYDYDGRQRMIKKKVPGAEPVYMVYDQRDRLVLTQDGNFRKDSGGMKWLFTKYDHLNRPIMSGEYTHSSKEEPEAMQDEITAFIGGTASKYYEDRKSDGTHGYTNRSFPKTGITNYLTVTYYDDYLFTTYTGNGFDNTLEFEPNSLINYDDQDGTNDGYFSRVKGQVTGSKTKVLGENTWLVSTSYYDDRYRPIQTVSENILDGEDRVSMQYDFVGKVLREEHEQTTSAGTVKISKRYEYDHAGRLLRLYHLIGDNPDDEILMAENKYNALGELIEKNIHVNETIGTMAQSTDYRYNIRGWLQNINNASLLDEAAINPDVGQPTDVFGMELMYDQQN